MALKVLLLRSKKEALQAQLSALRNKDEDFQTRKSELESAITELNAESTQEERDVVENQTDKFEAEYQEHLDAIKDLEEKVRNIEAEIDGIETAAPAAPKTGGNNEPQNRGQEVLFTMETRKGFSDLSFAEREALFQREDVKNWVERVRTMGISKRTVTAAETLLPEVLLDLVKSDVPKYSQLYSKVYVKQTKGKARQSILGAVPEAVWTEQVGVKLNELTLDFKKVEVDGYKVAGFIPVDNAYLEDTDYALGSEVLGQLAESIGYALDKAILFGGGSAKKQPIGIVTALEANIGVKATNVITVAAAKKDIDLFKELVKVSGVLKHSKDSLFWAMNTKTKAEILAASLGVNANAAIVSGMDNTMPVLGGDILEFDFMPDNMVVVGYGSRYLLAERAGTTVDYSTDIQFLEDNTVYRARARYDGKPVFDDSFAFVGLNGVAPVATSVKFAEDKANTSLPA